MKTQNKILLTIPSVLSLLFLLAMWFPKKIPLLTPTTTIYQIEVLSILVLMLVQLIILLYKLWSFKNISKSEKSEWTWYLILFNTIAALFLIWSKIDKMKIANMSEENEQLS